MPLKKGLLVLLVLWACGAPDGAREGGFATEGQTTLGGITGNSGGSGMPFVLGGAGGVATNVGSGGIAPALGGMTGTGGITSTGGVPGTGGKLGTGGKAASGGSLGSGGAPSMGRSIGTGGKPATGGAPGTAGITGRTYRLATWGKCVTPGGVFGIKVGLNSGADERKETAGFGSAWSEQSVAMTISNNAAWIQVYITGPGQNCSYDDISFVEQ